MKQAMVFPGQGAQRVGMGAGFLTHPVYVRHLAKADDILGFALSSLIAEGPQEALICTDRAQIALFVVSTGMFEVWRSEGGRLPKLMAGHSLGEYSALYAAGVWHFETALQLVARRGELMQQACIDHAGAMAAILNPEPAGLQALCADTEVVIANLNGPQQWVLSGPHEALAAVLKAVKSHRLGRGVPLKVAGAFHSPLMQTAQQALQSLLAQTVFQSAQVPVLMNTTAQPAQHAEEIKAALMTQICAPVRWGESMTFLSQAGISEVIECGPSILSPLLRQWPELRAIPLEHPDQIKIFI